MGDVWIENPTLLPKMRVLWDEGLSTAQIGLRLGISKNSVVGKAHREGFPGRPSPIRRIKDGAPPRARAPRRLNLSAGTLEPLASIAGPEPTIAAPPPAPRRIVRQPPKRAVTPPQPRPYGRVVTCCWPIGEPGTKAFRLCDGASDPGKPYCSDHCKLAYVRVQDRREDAYRDGVLATDDADAA